MNFLREGPAWSTGRTQPVPRVTIGARTTTLGKLTCTFKQLSFSVKRYKFSISLAPGAAFLRGREGRDSNMQTGAGDWHRSREPGGEYFYWLRAKLHWHKLMSVGGGQHQYLNSRRCICTNYSSVSTDVWSEAPRRHEPNGGLVPPCLFIYVNSCPLSFPFLDVHLLYEYLYSLHMFM